MTNDQKRDYADAIHKKVGNLIFWEVLSAMNAVERSTNKPVEIPEGYTLLEAGPTRLIGVNTSWLRYHTLNEGPIRIEDEDGDNIHAEGHVDFYDDVKILGLSELTGWEYARHGGENHPGKRTVRIKTTAALLVKPHVVAEPEPVAVSSDNDYDDDDDDSWGCR